MKKIRWGILGAGMILDRWMKGARQVEGMEIVAIASRTPERAAIMAERFRIPKVMTYEEMIASEEIDIVYIPVPHTAHKALAVRAMDAGKAVLVEKPAGINAGELQEMIDAARRNRVFFMEACWTRFFPMIEKIKAMIKDGAIGDVRAMNLQFSYRVGDVRKPSRLTDPNTAGGGLLDVGIYNLHFAQEILEKNPIELMGMATIHSSVDRLDVDEQAFYIGRYDAGELVNMSSAVCTDMPEVAYIYGTKGFLEIPVFYKPSKLFLVTGEENEFRETISMPVPQKFDEFEDEGYQFEIRHVEACLREGLKESPVMTWEKSMDIIRQADTLRRQWGLRYPMEKM